MDTKTFASEEDRNEFIAGDREKRVELDTVDILSDLKKLRKESQKINEASEELNNFYIALENYLRSFQISYALFLRDEDNTKPEDSNFQLCWSEEFTKDCTPVISTFYFWRIGYCKVGETWRLAALKYKVNPVEGELPRHEAVGEPIRLTHAPRDVRTSASHLMRHLVHALLKQVEYDESCVQNALRRMKPLANNMRGL